MTDPRAQQDNIATVMSRKQEILTALMSDIGGALELPASEVATDVPFLEMGADSIVMVEAIAIIEQRYGVKLALRQFFEELSTLEAVASHLDANIPTAPVVPPPPAAARCARRASSKPTRARPAARRAARGRAGRRARAPTSPSRQDSE